MDKTYLRFALLYNFSYMAIGSLTPLIGQYLQHIGFSGTQIGVITSTGTAVAIIASAFWGREYNKYNNSIKSNRIIMLLCLLAAVSCLGVSQVKAYWLFIPMFGVMYFFQSPVMSLTDAFTVQRSQRFGSLRAWGAVGFALGIFIAGNAADFISIKIIFVLYIICFLISAATVWDIGNKEKLLCSYNNENHIKTKAVKETKKIGYIELLKDTRLRHLIICTFFIGGTNVANNTYFSFLYLEAGGTVAGVGLVMLLMVGSEVPFMKLSEKISSRFTIEKTVLYAMIVSVIRFAAYGMAVPWWMLILLSFTQGAVNGILLVEFVRYVSKITSDINRSLAISSYYIIGSNMSTIVCQIIGGIVLENYSAAGVYVFFTIFNLIGVILYTKFRLFIEK